MFVSFTRLPCSGFKDSLLITGDPVEAWRKREFSNGRLFLFSCSGRCASSAGYRLEETRRAKNKSYFQDVCNRLPLFYGPVPNRSSTDRATARYSGEFRGPGELAGDKYGPDHCHCRCWCQPRYPITGFRPGIVVGTIRANYSVAAQAHNDATTAFNALAGQPCNTILTGQDLGGLTLLPGVYCFASSAQLKGTLTLIDYLLVG